VAAGLEREIKLEFAGADAARAAVVGAGAVPKHARRLQEDALLDTADGFLREKRAALRVRSEGDRTFVTFKGPVQPSSMKLREEIETVVGDRAAIFAILGKLGFRVWFRYEKFREEFTLGGCLVAIDETPAGVFVELEGEERAIADAARALGRSPADYILESYRGLHVRRSSAQGAEPGDMLFANSGASPRA
jgi:adenylate cyclase class 2